MMLLDIETSRKMLPYDIWLQEVLGAGNSRASAILDKYNTSYGVYRIKDKELKKSGLFTPKELEKAVRTDIKSALKTLEECKSNNISAIGIDNPDYPERLRNIPNPPVVLYYRGILPEFDNLPVICIVGPREATNNGINAAYNYSANLSKCGFLTVSGVAFGCDSAAHKGAADAKCRSVAVMPCGLLNDYLSSNRPIRDRILKNGGCILTECPPKMPVTKNAFEIRNRILSGLSVATLVVEAGEHSGALITARHANDQGRDVFALPGLNTMPEYTGCNRLIYDGATIVLNENTIIEQYLPLYGDKINIKNEISDDKSKNPEIVQKKSTESLSNDAKIVYNSLNKQKFTVDDLPELEIPENLVFAALTELEILGFIETLPGGFFTLK